MKTNETHDSNESTGNFEEGFNHDAIYQEKEEDSSQSNDVPGEEYLDESDSELEERMDDHVEVSNSEADAGELESDDESFGSEDPPDNTTMELGLEIDHKDNESVLELNREEVLAHMDEQKLLDAWYAEFADADMQALVSQQPELAKQFAEVVIGRDDRVHVKNTRSFPWRAICSLRITARDGSNWIGTGWLVGYRTVITAGHCVYIHRRGGWVRSIDVIPGRNAGDKPYGTGRATSFRSVKGWTQDRKRSHDYGAIILPSTYPVGRRVGYFGYANLSKSSLSNLKVNLSGYPGDKPTGTQWWHCRKIKKVTSRTLVYNIDTAGGQSGAPVWRYRNGKRHSVGIHTNGSSSGNSATRITKPVFDNIKKWKSQGM